MERVLGAIEMGGSKVLCAVGTSHGDVHARCRIETSAPDATLGEIERFFAPHAPELAAVGIASFGPLDLDPKSSRWGHLLRTPKVGWSDVSIAPRMQRALGVPVVIDTDVNAAALVEQRSGSGQGVDPCIYITVGTGVGVGVVIGGQALHGLMHPELGHLRAPDHCTFPGVCPFHGRCVEGLASAPALLARTGIKPELLPNDHPAWALEAEYLAHLVATCVLAYAPRRIVLGGGVLEREGLLDRVRDAVVGQLAGYVPLPELTREGISTFLVAPALGQDAGLAGAFLLAEAGCLVC